MRDSDYARLIELALREDLGDEGDVTSRAVVPDETCEARLWSKNEGALAGEDVFKAVFREVDASTEVVFHLHDGSALHRDDKVATVRGRARSILCAERTAINFIGFMSGISTATRRFVSLAERFGHAVILDTRKTLPGFRALSKYAVTAGGGKNHRQGLHDMVLIKGNHIDSAGSLTTAVERARRTWGSRFTVEVECRNLVEVREALAAGVDWIMLDNMGLDDMREAVLLTAGRAKLEASGNMSEERIGPVSATGVDYISVGKLTHSVQSFDFSLRIEREA